MRRKSDKASTTLIVFLIGFAFLSLAVSFSVDIAKTVYAKNNVSTVAQQAASAAIKNIDGRGSITLSALNDFADNYVEENVNGHLKKNSQCRSGVVEGYGTVSYPFFVMQLDTQRGGSKETNKPVYVMSGSNGEPLLSSGKFNPNSIYRVLTVDVYDSADNFMLGSIGIPCQNISTGISSIHFGNTEDLLVKDPSSTVNVPDAPDVDFPEWCEYTGNSAHRWKTKTITAPDGMGIIANNRRIDNKLTEGRITISANKKTLTYSTENIFSEFSGEGDSFTYQFFDLNNSNNKGKPGTVFIPNACF